MTQDQRSSYAGVTAPRLDDLQSGRVGVLALVAGEGLSGIVGEPCGLVSVFGLVR